MTGNQLKAARSLKGWTQRQLADAASLSVPTIKRAEGSAVATASEQAVRSMREALERAGIEFIEENGGGAGVRLKK
ncbi:helix-turn-helix domain-containing protein [uncultured Roseobacter sp.]|uniref:helix-turn-helix domain-containing protein n=1 Tax=uncultured Roseobacter sp. TaxID=114847 RepID=UPI002614FDC7|nr:helix-turn-helix domain-containing protein [uncultured Roseobacter sp.]